MRAQINNLASAGQQDVQDSPKGTRLDGEEKVMVAQSQLVELPATLALLQMIQGFWVARALWITAELGIPDLLKHGPKGSEELGQAAGTHPTVSLPPGAGYDRCRDLCRG